MTNAEKQSYVGTIRTLMNLACAMDAVDANNCEEIIKLINGQPSDDAVNFLYEAIDATNGNSDYDIGLKNGLRLAISVITKTEPNYETVNKPQPSEDCISRKAVKEAIMDCETFYEDRMDTFIRDTTVLEIEIGELPSVQPQPKKGTWIAGIYWSEGVGMGEDYGFYYKCSNCGNEIKGGYYGCDENFCSKCGADMRECDSDGV